MDDIKHHIEDLTFDFIFEMNLALVLRCRITRVESLNRSGCHQLEEELDILISTEGFCDIWTGTFLPTSAPSLLRSCDLDREKLSMNRIND